MEIREVSAAFPKVGDVLYADDNRRMLEYRGLDVHQDGTVEMRVRDFRVTMDAPEFTVPLTLGGIVVFNT
jgi:hypothetical protein